jgi:hypothetical protein
MGPMTTTCRNLDYGKRRLALTAFVSYRMQTIDDHMVMRYFMTIIGNSDYYCRSTPKTFGDYYLSIPVFVQQNRKRRLKYFEFMITVMKNVLTLQKFHALCEASYASYRLEESSLAVMKFRRGVEAEVEEGELSWRGILFNIRGNAS